MSIYKNLDCNSFNSFVNIDAIKINKDNENKLDFLINNYLNHTFDLLGSGPIKVKYNLEINEEESNNISSSNIPYPLNSIKSIDYIKSIKIIKYIDKNYKPIDWHIDFKSKFRFNARYFNNIQKCRSIIAKGNGVDIKVPWELGRLYHLVQMSILAIFNKNKSELLIREFKNQILDFIVVNPYKRTVQWSCVMSTSIRAVNLLISHDIFKQIDDKNLLDENFERIFYKFIKLHGIFIMSNLEYSKISNNHYLSNIAGLIFIASYMKSSEKTDTWLVFATQELIKEVKKQFYSEGSNFEGSTSYHRLSTEFVVYSTALIMSVLKTDRRKAYILYNKKLMKKLKPAMGGGYKKEYNLEKKDFFPDWYIDRLFLMGVFTKNITNNKDEITQIGDNDSGRLIKLSPMGDIIPYKLAYKKYYKFPCNNQTKYYFDENILNHTNLLSLISALFERDNTLNKYQLMFPLESNFIKSLSNNYKFNSTNLIYNNVNLHKLDDTFLKYSKVTTFNFSNISEPLNKNIEFINYDKFGICLFKSKTLYLCISVDVTKNTKLFGHSHNDKLSFELIVDGKNIVLDPGTYVYTPFPLMRDKFRSTKSHNTIIVGKEEQNNFKGVFGLTNYARGYIIDKKDNYIKLFSEYKDIKHIREFNILKDKIIITDYCNKEFNTNFNKNLYSNGYGKKIRTGFLIYE